MKTLSSARCLCHCFHAATFMFLAGTAAAHDEEHPNILLIVADDAGYADIGAFGSEIATPNLDALAAKGIRFTQFLTGGTCAPTRSMLLSGTDNHIAGVDSMAEMMAPDPVPDPAGDPGGEGVLAYEVAPLSMLLRDAGYNTFMAGQWDLGEEPESLPAARGFMHNLALISGGGSHVDNMWGATGEPQSYTLNGEPLEQLRPGFHSSVDYTDAIIANIEEHMDDGRPFFAYLALQAPHGPFHLPAVWRDIYSGRYDAGYDAIRAERIKRMQNIGILVPDATVFPRLPSVPAWDDLSLGQRRESARRMELYAAMVTHMDANIGNLMDFLRTSGLYEDTIIIFMSDNGPEGTLVNVSPPWDNSDMADWGREGTFIEYGPAWAQVSAGPFRMFKGYLSEGGIRSPMIISGPGVVGGGRISDALTHVMDIPATILELAGLPHPETYVGRPVAPLQGHSLVPLLADPAAVPRDENDWIGFELSGNRALRQGDWKILWLCDPAGPGHWQLFDLRSDPAETNDLSEMHPDIRDRMAAVWDAYAAASNVALPDVASVCATAEVTQ